MKQNKKLTVLGLLLATMLCLTVHSIAITPNKTIDVRGGVGLFIDDQRLIPKDAKGNTVDVFVYNGTTYIPARAVTEAFGKPIQWDSQTQSVYIGRHAGSSKPTAYLSDFDYFDSTGRWKFGNTTKDNMGVEHAHSIDNRDTYTVGEYLVYVLNGRYSNLTGTAYIEFDYRSYTDKQKVNIYGDDELLWTGTVGKGLDPLDFNVNVRGVNKLKIEICDGDGVIGSAAYFALGDVALWA